MHKYIDVAIQAQDFDLQRSLEQELKKLSEETGTTLLWIVGYINRVSRYNLRSGFTDLVKDTVLDIYDEIAQYQLPMTQGQAARLLIDIYIQQQDAEEAKRWGRFTRSNGISVSRQQARSGACRNSDPRRYSFRRENAVTV